MLTLTPTAATLSTAHAWAEWESGAYAGFYLIHRDAQFGKVRCGSECWHSRSTDAIDCAKEKARSYGYDLIDGWTGLPV